MKTTINDIAKIAGVSNATVSHVINNTRFVSPEVRKRVWRIIEDTGYDEKLKEIAIEWCKENNLEYEE